MEKQFWVDFAEGRIDVPQMLEQTGQHPELLDVPPAEVVADIP